MAGDKKTARGYYKSSLKNRRNRPDKFAAVLIIIVLVDKASRFFEYNNFLPPYVDVGFLSLAFIFLGIHFYWKYWIRNNN